MSAGTLTLTNNSLRSLATRDPFTTEVAAGDFCCHCRRCSYTLQLGPWKAVQR